MIAVLIPAHNEAAWIGACLRSVQHAAQHAELQEEVRIIVAVDRCEDATAAIARALGAHVVDVPAPGGVGLARAEAAALAVSWGARWLSMTDADTTVPHDWLVEQLRLCADAFCGIVEVDDWEDYAVEVQRAFLLGQCARDGHMRVHGANMGVSADFYTRCGGFPPLRCSEDVALIDALVGINARIARVARPAVRTSARRCARASGGFSDFIKQVEHLSLHAAAEPIAAR